MDRGARVIGMIVFVLGIAVLLLVFWVAYGMFSGPASALLPSTEGQSVNAIGLGSSLVVMLIRIALLFIMTLAGSLVAARGVSLYLGGCEVPRERVDE